MKLSYNGLWKILIDYGMQKKDLTEKLSTSSTTVAKIGKGEKVSLEVLERICQFFNCDIGDIISFQSIKDSEGV